MIQRIPDPLDREDYRGFTRWEVERHELNSRLLPIQTFASMFFRDYVQSLDEMPDRASSPNEHAAPASVSRFGETFQGWTYRSPPEPRTISPIPLDFERIASADSDGPAGGCPLPEFEPWWDQICAKASLSQPPLTGFNGPSIALGRRSGTSWQRGRHARYAGWGALHFHDDHFVTTFVVREAEARIKKPGFFGGMVPLYSEAKSLASDFTAKEHSFTFGSRIGYENISAVGVFMNFQTLRPLIAGKDWKALFERRGYGPPRIAMSIDFSDGWHPWRVTISDVMPKPHEADAAEGYALDVARWVIRHAKNLRLAQGSYLTDDERTRLAAVDSTKEVEVSTVKDERRSALVCHLPGAVPVSARLEPT